LDPGEGFFLQDSTVVTKPTAACARPCVALCESHFLNSVHLNTAAHAHKAFPCASICEGQKEMIQQDRACCSSTAEERGGARPTRCQCRERGEDELRHSIFSTSSRSDAASSCSPRTRTKWRTKTYTTTTMSSGRGRTSRAARGAFAGAATA
jgi:hypothetical protein